ncbi:MAG: hypothetical protein AB2A00_33630 [Myxococcota bacterium]
MITGRLAWALVVLASSTPVTPIALPPGPLLGVSVAHLHVPGFGYGSQRAREQLEQLRAQGANWVSVMPFFYLPASDSPEVRRGRDPTLRDEDWLQEVAHAHAAGLRVMLKPHLWIHGSWPGAVKMRSEADWARFFRAYRDLVVPLAEQAQRAGVDLFCVGVELKEATLAQPARWRALVEEVRRVYRGPVTYASNWDEVHAVSFWDALDAVGVDAYFPAADGPGADVTRMKERLLSALRPVDALATRAGRPLLLTEVGYPALHGGAARPWELPDGARADVDEAVRAWQALLEVAPGLGSLRGMFAWKWYTSSFNPFDRDAYSLEGTPAMHLLSQHYRRWGSGVGRGP